MKFIDSHCHLHDQRIIRHVDEIINRGISAGVCGFVSCATSEDNFESTARLSEDYAQILPCFGIHPWFVETCSENWKDILENFLTAYPSCVGETGLDFTNKAWDREKQIEIFSHHLELARTMKRPIIIHIRKAWDTFIHLLKKKGGLAVPGMVHSYSGSAELVRVLEKYNLYLSFSGSVTNPSSKKVVRALEKTSKERFVLETDTPDINPYIEGVRTEGLNEPGNLPAIARIAAQRTGSAVEDFAAQAYENTLHLFNSVMNYKKDEKEN